MSKNNIFSKLSAMPFAVLLMVISVIMMLAGVLPIEGADPVIIFRTPAFAAILGLLGLSILTCVTKKKLKLSSIGFHLVHIGVVLIMIGGLTAFIAEKYTTLHISASERPTQHIRLSENRIIDLGFSIHLKSFYVEHYRPDIIHLKNDMTQHAYRISEGKVVKLDSGLNLNINKITLNTKVISYELDGDPQLMIYNDSTLWKQVAVTGKVDSINMPDGRTLLISRAYNNLPTMQNNNFKESDYPTNPGLIMRLMSGNMMSILTLPANGKPNLLSARGPHAVILPDLHYRFPKVTNIKLAPVANGIASVNITTGTNTVNLLQDGGMLSRMRLPDNSVIQLTNPIDIQYHAEIEIDDLNGGKRTAILGSNHPIDEQGWRFYLNSHDSKGIIITARNDPGNKMVVTGILAVMIGMPIIFFFRKRRNNVMLAVPGQPARIASQNDAGGKLRAKPEALTKDPQHE